MPSPNLHANVIATDWRAVIGSANAPRSSTIADEAVVITDDPSVVASVRAFIDGIKEITEVDQAFLDDATAHWAAQISGPPWRAMLHPMQFHRFVIDFVSADDQWIYPPAVVVSDRIKIPRSGGAVLFFLRIRAGLSPLPLTDAETALTDLLPPPSEDSLWRHPGSRLRTDHFVRSPSLRTGLLALWDL